MLCTTVYLLGALGWKSYHGPAFVSLERAHDWAVATVSEEAQEGNPAAIAIWEQVSGEVVEEVRARRLGGLSDCLN
jgi:hypothetical protein